MQRSGLFVGLVTVDVIHRVQRSPGVNEKVTADQQFVAAGGPAANAAVTFAALGGRARLLTALGTGAMADVARADLTVCGVEIIDVTPAAVDRVPVSSVVVTAGTGDRSVVSLDGVGTALVASPSLVQLVEQTITATDVVLIDGHHPAVAVTAAQAAHRHGVTTVVDAGRWKPVMADLMAYRPEFVCSADFRAPGTTSPDESAQALVAAGLDPVVVTSGEQAVLWWQGGERGEVPVPSIKAVDTLAAGDVFHGAYALARTLAGLDLPGRLAVAAEAAALRCTVIGPRAWLEPLRQLNPDRREDGHKSGVS